VPSVFQSKNGDSEFPRKIGRGVFIILGYLGGGGVRRSGKKKGRQRKLTRDARENRRVYRRKESGFEGRGVYLGTAIYPLKKRFHKKVR